MNDTPDERVQKRPDDQQALVRFLLGEIQGADNVTPSTPAEERRRQRAVILELQRIAQEHGIDMRTIGDADSLDPRETQQALEIADRANPAMAQAASAVRFTGKSTVSVEKPDGTKVTVETPRHFEAAGYLNAAVGGLAGVDQVDLGCALAWLLDRGESG